MLKLKLATLSAFLLITSSLRYDGWFSVALGGVNAAATCGAGQLCPASAPCCSEFGFCGTGTYCLGGCNPLFSSDPGSCAPQPACVSKNYTFTDGSRLKNSSIYNNDATAVDFTVDKGQALISPGGELVMPLTQSNGGTRLSSTRRVQYGTITARVKTGRWPGVVVAFITMSDAKDEIDWEFPGNNVLSGQTNYFWLGDPDGFSKGGNGTISSSSYSNYHDYTIQWLPDTLTWLIDGKVVRTLTKASTLDSYTGLYKYPQTPARVQLSIWPAGIPSSPPGTVAWAGGMINWNDPDYTANGYFYGLVDSLSVQCYQGPNGASNPNGVSYTYAANDTHGEPQVVLGQTPTQIYSQLATGKDMAAGKTSKNSGNATNGQFGSAVRAIRVFYSEGGLLSGFVGIGLVVLGWVLLI